jgi:hypothetical protein
MISLPSGRQAPVGMGRTRIQTAQSNRWRRPAEPHPQAPASSLHLRPQLLEIQKLAIGAIKGQQLLGQRAKRFDPGAVIIRIHCTRLPLLANGVRTDLYDLPWIVPMLTEEARCGRKRIGKDDFFQSGPGKAIDRLQPLS